MNFSVIELKEFGKLEGHKRETADAQFTQWAQGISRLELEGAINCYVIENGEKTKTGAPRKNPFLMKVADKLKSNKTLTGHEWSLIREHPYLSKMITLWKLRLRDEVIQDEFEDIKDTRRGISKRLISEEDWKAAAKVYESQTKMMTEELKGGKAAKEVQQNMSNQVAVKIEANVPMRLDEMEKRRKKLSEMLPVDEEVVEAEYTELKDDNK